MAVDLFDTSFVDGYQYHWFNRIISLIMELLVFICFVYHMYLTALWKYKGDKAVRKTNRVLNTSSSVRKWQKASHIFTQLTLLSFVIMGGNYVFNTWSVYGERASCNAIEVFSVVSYHWCKFCLYVVLVSRIQVAFADSSYQDFTKKVLYFLYAVLFIFVVVCIYGDATTVGGALLYTSPKTFYCILLPLPSYVAIAFMHVRLFFFSRSSLRDVPHYIRHFTAWGLAFFLLSDIIISVSCCAAFIYPLKKLLKLTNANSQRNYIELIRKYAILTTTAVCSTLVLVLLNAVLRMGFLVLVDNVVNTLCIMLMSSWYDGLYDRLCCCCHKTVAGLDRAISSRSIVSNSPDQQRSPKARSKPHLTLKDVGSMSEDTHTISPPNEMVVITPMSHHEHEENSKEVTPQPMPVTDHDETHSEKQ